MKVVSKHRANICPECDRVLEPNEGSSESTGVVVTIQCPYCNGSYQYFEDGKSRVFFSELREELYLVNKEGEVFYLQPYDEDEDGYGYHIPDDNRQVAVIE